MAIADGSRFQKFKGLNSDAEVPTLTWQERDNKIEVSAFGDWQVQHVRRLAKEIRKLGIQNSSPDNSEHRPALDINLEGLEALDTAGAMLILDMKELFSHNGFAVNLGITREADRILFDLISRHPREKQAVEEKSSMVLNLVRDLGAQLVSIYTDIVEITAMIGQVSICMAGLIVRPWRIRFTSLIHHLEHAGLKAVTIISLICFLIGAVIMQQSIEQLRFYSAEHLSIDMLGILALREVGVLLTCIMIAGRSGASFTAEIGSMKMREEVDAMRALGIDPVETLIVPRVLALVIALPLLTFIGDMMCLAGGAVTAYQVMDMDLTSFLQQLNTNVEIRHFWVGLIKTPFAAVIIGIVGTLEGMRVRGSAESLGTHVRASVVKSIFLVIILDAMFAMALTSIGV